MKISTLFIVADEPGVLSELSDLCKQAKLHSETFTSAEAFLAEFDPEHPGCLLLDMSLRGMRGGEFHSMLVQRQSIIPVIILTSPSDARSAMEMLKGGALDFFEKPFDAMTLLSAIKPQSRWIAPTGTPSGSAARCCNVWHSSPGANGKSWAACVKANPAGRSPFS